MSRCSEHVDYQFPNAQTIIKYLLEATKWSNAGLQAVMTMVRNDDGPEGKLNNFELMVACLLPHGLVAKRKTRK